MISMKHVSKQPFFRFFLCDNLFQNALQLGLNTVSDAYVDGDDGHAKSKLLNCALYAHAQFPPAVTLTPSRSLCHTSRPHAILVAVDLCYIWKTAGDREDSTGLLGDASPFADNLYLPFELLLKRVTEQLFNQLVGCVSVVRAEYMRSHMAQTLSSYLWDVVQSMLILFLLKRSNNVQRLDMESEYFPSVAQSILEIMRRSPNPHFVARCKRLIKVRFLFLLVHAINFCLDCTRSPSLRAPDLCGSPLLVSRLPRLRRLG